MLNADRGRLNFESLVMLGGRFVVGTAHPTGF
jgi:hypothetical protein